MSHLDGKPTMRRLETDGAPRAGGAAPAGLHNTNDSSSTLAGTHRNSGEKKFNAKDESQVNTARLENPFAEKSEVSESRVMVWLLAHAGLLDRPPVRLGCLHPPRSAAGVAWHPSRLPSGCSQRVSINTYEL